MADLTPIYRAMLDGLRAENERTQRQVAVTVWPDGSYKIWSQRDAEIAEKAHERGGDPVLVTINLPVDLALVGPQEPRGG